MSRTTFCEPPSGWDNRIIALSKLEGAWIAPKGAFCFRSNCV